MDEKRPPSEAEIAEMLRAEGRAFRAQPVDPEESDRFWLGLLERLSTTQQVPVFVCPDCFAPTTHPKDIEQGYCGRCHNWTGVRQFTDEDFEALVDGSSLGTPMARALQAQCPPQVRERFRRHLEVLEDMNRAVAGVRRILDDPSQVPEGDAMSWYLRKAAAEVLIALQDSKSPNRTRFDYCARVFAAVFERLVFL